MTTSKEKGETFCGLHRREGAFIIPNPWDRGTARILAALGFEALATTSAGYAFSVGQRDNTVGRDETLTHASEIASATDLPVSADLENGFGDSPEEVAETVERAASTGIVGCSIEDATGRSGNPIYDQELAIERIRAAVEVVRRLPFVFTLTARCENYLVGRTDLKATITRLQAYEQAGADVLFAPGLTDKADIADVVKSVSRPLNVLLILESAEISRGQLSEIGVKRISLGSGLSRVALGALLRAGQEMQQHGTFGFAKDAPSFKTITEMLAIPANLPKT